MTLDDLVSQSAPAGKASPTKASALPAPTTSLDDLIAASKGNGKAVVPTKNPMSPEAVAANSTSGLIKNTILGIPKAALDEGRSIAQGAGNFALSAGEAIPRLLNPKLSTAILPPVNVPGLTKITGPLQSFESQAAQNVQNGSSVPGAVARGTLDTVLNDPLGVAFKPALAGVGVLGKFLSENQAAKEEMARLLERAASIKSGEANSEFQGMSLPERLNATGERKLPVTGDTSLRKLPVSGESVEKTVPIASKYESELPTIEAGTTPRDTSGLPTIKSDAPTAKSGDITYHPIDDLIEKSKPTTNVSESKPISTVTEKPVVAPKTPVETPSEAPERASQTTPGGTKVSGVAKDIQTKAVENGLIDQYKDTATYDARNIKEQAQKISDVIAKDPEDLGRMVRGEIPVPKDISPSYLITAADKYATKTGDTRLLQDLVSSKLTGEGSMHASELRMLGEREPSSAVQALKEIKAAKEAGVSSRIGEKDIKTVRKATVKTIKDEVAKTAPKKEDWNSFINSLVC